MKALVLTPAVLLLMAMPAHAETADLFTGGFSVANWTLVQQGGLVDTSGAPDWVTFTGADDDRGPSEQSMTIVAATPGHVSFHWTYETADSAPVWDAFGFLLNSSFIPVSSDLGESVQSGSFTFTVAAGDSFGFAAQSYDSTGGSATTRVSQFRFEETPVVPEPGTLPLMALALAAGVLWRQTRARRLATNQETQS